MIIRTMQTADAVLATLETLQSEIDFYLEPYQNGREHGWSISNYPKRVCFSENRNSDNIVVYYGNSQDFSMQGNVPNEKVYRSAKYFGYNGFLDAAKFIFEFMTK